MIVIKNEHVVCFDVDQTLFMHTRDGVWKIINPYSGSDIYGNANHSHIELMKQYKSRGLYVIVWSKAGVLWVEAVIKQFNLEKLVDLIITKPDRHVDDLTAEFILGERVYLTE